MDRTYHYLGGDELHTGMYVSLLRRLEREDLVVDLIARVRVSPNPVTLWRAWTHRHLLGPNPITALRGQIRGEPLRRQGRAAARGRRCEHERQGGAEHRRQLSSGAPGRPRATGAGPSRRSPEPQRGSKTRSLVSAG